MGVLEFSRSFPISIPILLAKLSVMQLNAVNRLNLVKR